MKKITTIIMLLFAALAFFTVPANAAKQVNDVSDINWQFSSRALRVEPENWWT
jgi:hypothetical protein